MFQKCSSTHASTPSLNLNKNDWAPGSSSTVHSPLHHQEEPCTLLSFPFHDLRRQDLRRQDRMKPGPYEARTVWSLQLEKLAPNSRAAGRGPLSVICTGREAHDIGLERSYSWGVHWQVTSALKFPLPVLGSAWPYVFELSGTEENVLNQDWQHWFYWTHWILHKGF